MATNIIDGGGSVVGDAAQWQGPFVPGEVAHFTDEYFDEAVYSTPLLTTTAKAARLLASDPPWWTISVGQVIDGGTASTGSFSNVIDGGSA